MDVGGEVSPPVIKLAVAGAFLAEEPVIRPVLQFPPEAHVPAPKVYILSLDVEALYQTSPSVAVNLSEATD